MRNSSITNILSGYASTPPSSRHLVVSYARDEAERLFNQHGPLEAMQRGLEEVPPAAEFGCQWEAGTRAGYMAMREIFLQRIADLASGR
jgi:hypothetical protein